MQNKHRGYEPIGATIIEFNKSEQTKNLCVTKETNANK